MSPLTYRVLHLAGVIFLFLALGGGLLRALAGSQSETGRKLVTLTHGLALLLLLITGFGLLATLPLGFPAWAWVKIILWLALGAAAVLVRKLPRQAALWWIVLPLLGVVAAYLGVFKPF